MFTLVRNDMLELAAAVPARQASAVRVGQVVHFVADARRFDGRVARVSPDDRSGDPRRDRLRAGAQPGRHPARRHLRHAVASSAARSPTCSAFRPARCARRQDDGQPFVYRIDGKTLDVAPVQLGAVDERQGVAQVTDGLRRAIASSSATSARSAAACRSPSPAPRSAAGR